MATSPQQPTHVETREQSLLDSIVESQAHVAARYMPTLTVKQFSEREKLISDLRGMLVEGVDYGVIPGTDKPSLLLPGAQKVCAYFAYVPRYTVAEGSIEDWNGARFGEPLFYYSFKCELEKDGKRVGEGVGACSSWESKYRYRWMSSVPAGVDASKLVTRDATLYEPEFAIKKRETTGKFGKPPAYWDQWDAAIARGDAVVDRSRTKKDGSAMVGYKMGGIEYRVPNADFADTINTVLKMAKKRAYIDATLSATGLSQYFTQDVEDAIDTGGHPAGTQAAADHVAEAKINGAKAAADVPEPLRRYFADRTAGWFTRACNFVQAEMIAAAGTAGDQCYMMHAGALRDRFPKGQAIPPAECEKLLLILWGEIPRLVKEAQAARESSEDSAFALG